MKAVLSLALGVMTAIGGFVDIGNLVTSGITGARFGMTLAWAVVVGTAGMVLFAEMAGRVTAVTRKPIFHVVRERLGVRVSLVNAAASGLLNLLTLAAELGGVSLVLQMVTGISYLIWVPLAGLAAWLVIWRMPFQWMENIFGLLGLGLIVFVVALFHHGCRGAGAAAGRHRCQPPEPGRAAGGRRAGQGGAGRRVHAAREPGFLPVPPVDGRKVIGRIPESTK